MTMTLDLQPQLEGKLLQLRPLRPDDWDELFAVASDPLIRAGLRTVNVTRSRCSASFLARPSNRAAPWPYWLEGRIIGSSRYVGHGPPHDELEIGWTFQARAYWGGTFNREMKRLMLQHAFLSVDRVIFIVGVTNIRSQKAMLKAGGVLTDRREARMLHGRPSESVIFEITRPS